MNENLESTEIAVERQGSFSARDRREKGLVPLLLWVYRALVVVNGL
jgi:hypothetical protein